MALENISMLQRWCRETLWVRIIQAEGTGFPGKMDNEFCSGVRAAAAPAPKLSRSELGRSPRGREQRQGHSEPPPPIHHCPWQFVLRLGAAADLIGSCSPGAAGACQEERTRGTSLPSPSRARHACPSRAKIQGCVAHLGIVG